MRFPFNYGLGTRTIEGMDRRGFFGALAALAATASLDPERLLWVPGRKLISIPGPRSLNLEEFYYLFARLLLEKIVVTETFNYRGIFRTPTQLE